MKQCFIILLTLFCLWSPSPAAEKPKPPPAPEKSEPVYSSVEERRLLMALKQDRQNLNRERQQLEEKKKELKRLEAEVDKKLDQLKGLRLELEKLLAEKSEAEQKRISELSKMYAKMNPEKAARILSTLDQDLAIAVMENIKIKSAARILNNLDRDTAVRISTAFSKLEASKTE